MLTIDCCDQQAIVGLVSGDRLVAVLQTPPNLRTAVSLVPLIQSLYQQSGEVLGQTQAIAVTYGPGSFTSLRIGLTVAKSLAYASQLPLIGVNSLDGLLLSGRIAWLRQNPLIAAASGETGPQSPRGSLNLVGRVAKAAYRSQVYQKDVVFHPEYSAAVDPASLQQRLDEFAQFHATNPAVLRNDETRLSEWACGQAQPSVTPLPEEAATASLWKTVQGTQLRPAKGWPEPMADADAPICQILVGDLPKDCDVGAGFPAVFRAPPPTLEESVNSIARLAWETLLVAHPAAIDPMFVQPVYFRASAAEENLG